MSKSKGKSKDKEGNNFVSEWFGQRMYPMIICDKDSLAIQRSRRCPFLSSAQNKPIECIKPDAAKGVCTINSASNGPKQDWVVCPYRVFDRTLINDIVRRLYGIMPDQPMHLYAAPTLVDSTVQSNIASQLDNNERVLVYFEQKLGGEIQIPASDKSPQMSFDTTFVEIKKHEYGIVLDKFSVIEIQTMDFHGSYKQAVDFLNSAVTMFPELDKYKSSINDNQWWMAKGIEGPNIANVFKRTFYQLMFKFEMASSDACAGCVLVIPEAVWDSWHKFLGAPKLQQLPEGLYLLDIPKEDDETADIQPGDTADKSRSFIYVFDLDSSAQTTISPMQIKKVISTNAAVLAHHALERAPKGSIEQLGLTLYPTLQRRIAEFWRVPISLPDYVSTAKGKGVQQTRLF